MIAMDDAAVPINDIYISRIMSQWGRGDGPLHCWEDVTHESAALSVESSENDEEK